MKKEFATTAQNLLKHYISNSNENKKQRKQSNMCWCSVSVLLELTDPNDTEQVPCMWHHDGNR